MRRFLPVCFLFVLSPLVAEVLIGNIPLTHLFSLSRLPLLLFYGTGAILIREVARRRGLGWSRIVLLGIAFGLLEEGPVLQTVFTPSNSFQIANLTVGRAFGVNWLYAETVIGYHAIWSIVLPLLLTELLFANQRSQPWLGTVGLWVDGVIFTLIALFGGFAFAKALHATTGYVPPLLPNLVAVGLIALLVWLALRRPRSAPGTTTPAAKSSLPPIFLLWLFGLIAADGWFGFATGFGSEGALLPVWAQMLQKAILAGIVWICVRFWSAPDRQWHDLHRLALASGPLLVSAYLDLRGHWGMGADFLSQLIVSAALVLFLLILAWKVRLSAKLAESSPSQSDIPALTR